MSEMMIETEVGRLAVRTEGAGQATPVVLWHSLFVDDRTWDRVVPDLSKGRRLVRITGPGHGTSGDPGHRYTMADCAAAARTVLRACGVDDPVDWIGNAWGGHVGIVFAARHPELLSTLVTAGTPVHAYGFGSRLQTQVLLLLYRAVGPIGYLTNAVTSALLAEGTREQDPAAVELVRTSFADADRAGMANALVSISLRRPDLTPLLASIQAPVLFVTGSEHPDWSPAQARAAAALLPQGAAAVAQGAAYLVPLETPAEFVRMVEEFWSLRSSGHPAGDGTRDAS